MLRVALRCAVVLTCLSTTANAQFFIGARGGYAYGAFGKDLGYHGLITRDTSILNAPDTEILDGEGNAGEGSKFVIQGTNYGSAGTGVPIALEFGYRFKNSIFVQLDVQGLLGSWQTIMDFSGEDYQGNREYKQRSIQSTQIRLAPQIGFHTEVGVYARMGAILPVWGKSQLIETSSTYLSSVPVAIESEMEMTLKGSPTVGGIVGLGYEYVFKEKVGLFLEGELVALSIRRKEHEMTKLLINGDDGLEIQRKNDPGSVNWTYDKDTPQSPYSTIGLNFGVRIFL